MRKKLSTFTKEKETKAKPSEWDFFLFQVRKYREDEFAKFIKDKEYFDKVIDRINHIADETKSFLPNVVTKIIKDDANEQKDSE